MGDGSEHTATGALVLTCLQQRQDSMQWIDPHNQCGVVGRDLGLPLIYEAN